MKSYQNHSLEQYNTFAIPAVCPKIYFPCSLDELKELCLLEATPWYVLGEGSNTLFIDENTPVIIKPEIKGISVLDKADCFVITVGCGENWHQLVSYCIDNDYGGLENLALIPGSVGAAPVQNIGAYGVEVADFITQVHWFEFSSQILHKFNNEDCQFDYRESIFKNELLGKGVIVDITLTLPKLWQPKLSYAGLDHLPNNVSMNDVFQKVISIRQAKLPDPKVLPNCGSFFKNPIVNQNKLQALQSKFGDMPAYPQTDGKVKLAAGWLIDKAGFKGFRDKGVGIHELQALVLVNYESKKGQCLAHLAKTVQTTIARQFGIQLEVEVRILSNQGLISLNGQKSD